MNESTTLKLGETQIGALISVPEKNAMDVLSERLNLISALMKEKMKKDVDYGEIPGCDKPSLWQPGAEKLGVLFGVFVKPFEIEDLSAGDEIRFRVCMLAESSQGAELGSSYAECSSFEEKYKWRKAVCDQEWEETTETRRREKWFKGKWKNGKPGQPFKVKQVLRDPEDLRNTILFMAQKRGFVAVMRRVTGASDIFTQEGDFGDERDKERDRPEMKKPQEKKHTEKNTQTKKPQQKAAGTIPDGHMDKLRNIIADFQITEIEVLEILKGFGYSAIEDIQEEHFIPVKKKIESKGQEKINAA